MEEYECTARGQGAALLHTFYTTPRVGAARLSDGGGPFGFDVTVAIQVDHLVRTYGCDAIIETGCFLGDTTEYLARQYYDLPVVSCDLAPNYAAFTRRRVAAFANARVLLGDSAVVLARIAQQFERPLVYLDAHWNSEWPLRGELDAVSCGLVVVDDFDVGHPRFSFDVYDNEACDARLIKEALPDQRALFVGNPFFSYTYPCLQVGRRAGKAYMSRHLGDSGLADSKMFVEVPLQPEIEMPRW